MGSVFFQVVLAVILIRASALLDAIGTFCKVAVRISVLLGAVRISILSDRNSSSSSSSSDQCSFGGSWSILRSGSSDHIFFGRSSDQYPFGS